MSCVGENRNAYSDVSDECCRKGITWKIKALAGVDLDCS